MSRNFWTKLVFSCRLLSLSFLKELADSDNHSFSLLFLFFFFLFLFFEDVNIVVKTGHRYVRIFLGDLPSL